MAEQDKILKEELNYLVAQEFPILEGENRNSLMLLTLFLAKTKNWNGESARIKVQLKNMTEYELTKLMQSARMRLSRMRQSFRLRKVDYKQFIMLTTIVEQTEPDKAGCRDYTVEMTKVGNKLRGKNYSLSVLEEYL